MSGSGHYPSGWTQTDDSRVPHVDGIRRFSAAFAQHPRRCAVPRDRRGTGRAPAGPVTMQMAIGLGFTSWKLDRYSSLAGSIALAGGLVVIPTLRIRSRFSGRAIVLWSMYAVFVGSIIVTA
jgi:hypothetical protein